MVLVDVQKPEEDGVAHADAGPVEVAQRGQVVGHRGVPLGVRLEGHLLPLHVLQEAPHLLDVLPVGVVVDCMDTQAVRQLRPPRHCVLPRAGASPYQRRGSRGPRLRRARSQAHRVGPVGELHHDHDEDHQWMASGSPPWPLSRLKAALRDLGSPLVTWPWTVSAAAPFAPPRDGPSATFDSEGTQRR
eukprot:5946987-Pyramimonas_sp.AAC.1